jgi:hypothetical protein
MNQVKKDMILKIHSDHPLTCPIINSLQYISPKGSKTYSVEIEKSADQLYIDITPLVKVVDDLNHWGNDLVKFYNNMPEELKDEVKASLTNKDSFALIDELIKKDYTHDLNSYQILINEVVDRWENEHIEYTESVKAIEETKETIDKQQKKLDKLNETGSTNNQTIMKLKEAILENEDSITNLENYTEYLQEYFEHSVKHSFDELAFEFSNYLENMRARNDRLRDELTELRELILEKGKFKLKLFQPIEFLNNKFGVTDLLQNKKVANIGLISNQFDYMSITADINKDGKWYFSKLVSHLEKKGQLTDIQKEKLLNGLNNDEDNMMTEESRKRTLFQMLSDNGYTQVRYYETLKLFMQNPDETMKTEITTKIDCKIPRYKVQ